MLELAKRADEKGVKVAVGLMCRHCDRRRELYQRLREGEAGELIAFRGYREHDPVHNLDLAPGRGEMDELLWQLKRFHNFLWASGGIFSDYCVHHIDEVAWMQGSWPVRADAPGGRHYRGGGGLEGGGGCAEHGAGGGGLAGDGGAVVGAVVGASGAVVGAGGSLAGDDGAVVGAVGAVVGAGGAVVGAGGGLGGDGGAKLPCGTIPFASTPLTP
jgi:predicted dehydrogenase